MHAGGAGKVSHLNWCIKINLNQCYMMLFLRLLFMTVLSFVWTFICHRKIDILLHIPKTFFLVNSPKSLVSELQLAFVTFLVGQMWDGWEHWRALLSALCRAQQLIEEEPRLYDSLLSVLHFQINEVGGQWIQSGLCLSRVLDKNRASIISLE